MESPVASPVAPSAGERRGTPHIFTELKSHEDLQLPVRGSKRLKYTCITCSRQYIALGASHGGLYIFQRDTLKYLQQIGNKEGLIKAVFSPDENVVGMATSGGAVIVWKLNVTLRQKPERIAATKAHWNRQITSLCWDDAGLRLFSGDERGRITVTNTDSSKPSGIFKFQSEQVADVDSSIIQMDFANERLLVSTMTRCYLCDPKKGLSFQIGTKLRDGAYGACFLKTPCSEKPSIFCARPGSRMWEANTLCQVLNTHQFKQLLATPPLPVMGKGREVKLPAEDASHPPQSLAFPLLYPLGNHFLVTWNDRGVFVFDPVSVDVVFWTSDISGLLDVSVSKSSLYCLHQDGNIRKYTLQNVARCAASLFQQGLLIQCSRLVLRFQALFQRSRARRHMPPRNLHELAKRVASEDSILGCEVEELAVSAENRVLDVPSTASSRRSSLDSYDGMRLQSGIYVVRKRLDSECSDDLPLGYDAHMEMLGTPNESRRETIQETFSLNVETVSEEEFPTEDTKQEVDADNFVKHVNVTICAKEETLSQDHNAVEISSGDIESRDRDLDEDTSHEQEWQAGDKSVLMVSRENENDACDEKGPTEGDVELDKNEQRRRAKDKSDVIVVQEYDSDASKEKSPMVGNMEREEREPYTFTGYGLQEDVDESNKRNGEAPRFGGDESTYMHEANSIISTTQHDESSRQDGGTTFEDESEEAPICLVESDSGNQLLASSSRNHSISTPDHDALKNENTDTEENVVQNDRTGDATDVQSSHPNDCTSAKEGFHHREDIEPQMEESGMATDISVDLQVHAVDSSIDQESVWCDSACPIQDVPEVEEAMQDELLCGGISLESPLMKLETKDSGTAEGLQLVASPEINQMNTALDNIHSSVVPVTSTFDPKVERSREEADALQSMQSHQDVDIERGVSQQEDEREKANHRNKRLVEHVIADTQHASNDEKLDSLTKPCQEQYRANAEESYLLESYSRTTKHQQVSAEEEDMEIPAGLLRLPLQNEGHTAIDASGFGLDVSGFGIDPSENTCDYPSQVPNKGAFGKSATPHQSIGYDEISKDTGDSAAVQQDLHQSSRSHGHRSSASVTGEDLVMTSYPGEKRSDTGDIWKQEDRIFVSEDSSSSVHTYGHRSDIVTKLTSDDHSEQPDFYTSTMSSLSSNKYAVDDSFIASSENEVDECGSISSNPAVVDQSLPSKERECCVANSSENLEIVREDDLEVAEGDSQFPDAETELVKSVTESWYAQREAVQRHHSVSLEDINQESLDKNAIAPSAAIKRKKTKSRIIDITETVSRKPSPLDNLAPGSVLYRPTSLPDLSLQSSSQPGPVQSTPSSAIPSPALTPKKEDRKSSPAGSALPSPNLIMAAASGLPHVSGLMETQQIILNSTAQINLKAVKNSLTSKLSKTKTFLQSIGDSNPLSPKEGEKNVPPVQPYPSPSSSPISGSPTHRKGTPGSVTSREIPYQHSTSKPHPSLVSSPLYQPQGEFPYECDEEGKEEQVDSRLSADFLEATKTAILALQDPEISFSIDAMRGVLQSWVNELEQAYRSCQAEGIESWSKGILPLKAKEDVGCLAMRCFSMDIYADEESLGNSDEETVTNVGSPFEQGEELSESSKLDRYRALFIKRHYKVLDRERILEVLQYKQGYHTSAVRAVLQSEEGEAQNHCISEALDSGNAQEAIDNLLRANLTSSNLPLSLSFLRRLCSLDSGRALDVMISEYPTINPWHAYHILLEQPLFKSLVLRYVESSLMTHTLARRKQFIQQVMTMKPMALSLAEAALTFDPPSSSVLFCDCGELPRLGSHLIKWSHDQILDMILTSDSLPAEILLGLFLRAGYWHGAIVLMARERSHSMDALKLCIQLGDHALISNNERDLIPSSEEDWRNVLDWMKRCQPSRREADNLTERRCLNCGVLLSVCDLTSPGASEELSEVVVEAQEQGTDGMEERLSPSSQPECDWSVTDPSEPHDQSGSLIETDGCGRGETKSVAFDGDTDMNENSLQKSGGIKNLQGQNTMPSSSVLNDSDWLPTVTWQRIALLLVSHLGALKGVQLLKEVQVPEGMLGREFHQMCLYVSMWEKRQSLLSHAMLEGTDAYLWSKRQSGLGPRLQHLIRKEYQEIRQGCTNAGSEGERILKAQELLSQNQLYVEDPGTHWGRATNLGRICRVCNQSVAWSSVLQSSGCIVFPCGHVFHTLCIPEKACILCFYSNREIML